MRLANNELMLRGNGPAKLIVFKGTPSRFTDLGNQSISGLDGVFEPVCQNVFPVSHRRLVPEQAEKEQYSPRAFPGCLAGHF